MRLVKYRTIALLLLGVLAACGLSFNTLGQEGTTLAPKTSAETAVSPAGIEWWHDLEKAKAESLKDGRPVIAYFTYDT